MITPMVARLMRDPIDREGCLFELKWDGFRAVAETDGQGAVKLYSRNQNDFKKRFPPIAQALAELGRRTILDGEIVALDEGGFVNISGHSQTGYFPPVPMQDIQVDIKGRYRQARALRAPGTLQLTLSDNRARFRLPKLTDCEVVVLE